MPSPANVLGPLGPLHSTRPYNQKGMGAEGPWGMWTNVQSEPKSQALGPEGVNREVGLELQLCSQLPLEICILSLACLAHHPLPSHPPGRICTPRGR